MDDVTNGWSAFAWTDEFRLQLAELRSEHPFSGRSAGTSADPWLPGSAGRIRFGAVNDQVNGTIVCKFFQGYHYSLSAVVNTLKAPNNFYLVTKTV